MLISNVTDICRDILQDFRPPYRYPDARLIRYFNQGLQEVKRLRPDLLIGADGETLTLTEYTDADLGEDFPLEDMYLMPVAEFVIGMIELSDDEFTTSNRVVAVLTAFRMALMGDGNAA